MCHHPYSSVCQFTAESAQFGLTPKNGLQRTARPEVDGEGGLVARGLAQRAAQKEYGILPG